MLPRLRLPISLALLGLCVGCAGAHPGGVARPSPARITISYATDSPQLDFAVSRLESSLRAAGRYPVRLTGTQPRGAADILIGSGEADASRLDELGPDASLPDTLRAEGFQLKRVRGSGRDRLLVLGSDSRGAMYGTLDLAEQIRTGGRVEAVEERVVNARFPFRAVKFNLPWSAYRGSAHPAMGLHTATVRDLRFWERFLDMMAENRFNALTLWNLHPFTYMVRPTNFPEASPFSDAELAEWQHFWRALFRMAKERGIDTYIVSWNIFVSPEFAAAHGLDPYEQGRYHFGAGYKGDLVRRYNRELVTQVIDEYPDLTGLGFSLGERMENMTPEEREEWIRATYYEGIRRAKRKVKVIHRAPFSIDPEITRRTVEGAGLPDPVWMELKFNWSHGHSTPHLSIVHGGAAGDRYWNPPPEKHRIAWMIRNEDFFVLRWGQPDFIRAHIAENGAPHVGGYFVGSEGYIPAAEYSHRRPSPHLSWDYAFEKQWLFYMLWGRLLYDPSTPDAVFAHAFDRRYGTGTGEALLDAYSHASRMPLHLASFHRGTWDFTLYSEGFLAPARSGGLFDGVSPFISIDELIAHETLDPAYLSIPDYVRTVLQGREPEPARLTPLELADDLQRHGSAALGRVRPLAPPTGSGGGPLACETADVEAWAHLSHYFAEKLRAGVALETFRRTGRAAERAKAVARLQEAAGHWDRLVAVTAPHYQPIPAVQLGTEPFAWDRYRDQVLRDVEIARTSQPTPVASPAPSPE